MSYQLTVIYHQPEDSAAFDAYYAQTHAPLAEDLPGWQSFTTCRPGDSSRHGELRHRWGDGAVR